MWPGLVRVSTIALATLAFQEALLAQPAAPGEQDRRPQVERFLAAREELKGKLSTLREHFLPATPDIIGVRRPLMDAGCGAWSKTPLAQCHLTIGAPVSEEDHAYLPVELSGEGQVEDVLSLLDHLERLHRVVTVSDLSLSWSKERSVRFATSAHAVYAPGPFRNVDSTEPPVVEGISPEQIKEYRQNEYELDRLIQIVERLRARPTPWARLASMLRVGDWSPSLYLSEVRASRGGDDLALRGVSVEGVLDALLEHAGTFSASIADDNHTLSLLHVQVETELGNLFRASEAGWNVGSTVTRDGDCVNFDLHLNASNWKTDAATEPYYPVPPKPELFLPPELSSCRVSRDEGPVRKVTATRTGPFSLSLVGVDVADAFLALHEVSGAAFVVAGDVRGRVDVDLQGVSLDEAVAALGPQLGFSLANNGRFRRISHASTAMPARAEGSGQPISLKFTKGDLRDVFNLISEISGLSLFLPKDDLGQVSVLTGEVPWDVAFEAVLDAAGLAYQIDDDVLRIFHRDSPGEPLFFSTLRERGDRARIQAFKAYDLKLAGFVSSGEGWKAYARARDGRLYLLTPGTRLIDSTVSSISSKDVIVETELDAEEGKIEKVKRAWRLSLPRSLPPITLARDTTSVTSPLLANGAPDFVAWLNQKYSAGVTPAANAVQPLNEAFARLVDAGNMFWDNLTFPGDPPNHWPNQRVTTMPWTASDCPGCASRLALNQKPLAAIVEATRRPHYFVRIPSDVQVDRYVMPSLVGFRKAGYGLAGRGMLRLGSGELDGAIQDALAVQRMARLVAQPPWVVYRLIAVAQQVIGSALLPRIASAPSLTREKARSFLRGLRALPEMPSICDGLDGLERLPFLETMLRVREAAGQGGPACDRACVLTGYLEPASVTISDSPPPAWAPEVFLLPAEAVDWDEVLRNTNRRFDRRLDVLRARSSQDRSRARLDAEAEDRRMKAEAEAALALLRAGVRSDATRNADVVAAAESLGGTPAGRKQLASLWLPQAPPFERVAIAENEGEAQFRLGTLALALAAHRLETGRYPVSLDKLTPGLLSGRLAPAEPMRGYVLRYEAGPATGYTLTAVPEEVKQTGYRAFCLDATGATRWTTDGTAPGTAGGVCDPTLRSW